MRSYLKNFIGIGRPFVKLWIVFGVELSVVLAVVLEMAPREAVLFSTALLVFFILFASIEEAVLLFIISIPLYAALPVTETFDTMSGWRVLLTLLFIRIFFISIKNRESIFKISENTKKEKLYLYVSLFFVMAFLSLVNVESLGYGLRKIFFLANTMMLFFVILKSGVTVKKIQLFSIFSMMISLIIGYLQIILVFFIPLYYFWQWWANRVISVFYGNDLAHLLSYSNTWFSYYEGSLPTLRIFSVFPDSHSFALFSLIGLIPLTYLWIRKKNDKILIGAGAVALLSIVLSGSRGLWVSAVLLAIILLVFYVVIHRIPKLSIPNGRILFPFFAIIAIFFLLFPASSMILSTSRIGNMEKGSDYESLTFKRAKSVLNLNETSNRGRIDIWKLTIKSFSFNPFLGVGIGNYPVILNESPDASRRGASAHNLYLDILAETGILGFSAFLLILWAIFEKARKIFYNRGDCENYGIIFIFYFLWILLYSSFDVVLLNDKVLLLFIVQVAVLYLAKNTPRNLPALR